MKKKQKKIENWEEEFDKLWEGKYFTPKLNIQIKSFIRQLLQERKGIKQECKHKWNLFFVKKDYYREPCEIYIYCENCGTAKISEVKR